MMTIKDLLMANGYPNAWVQGHHTRIIMTDEGSYIVYQRINKDSPSSQYTVELYRGDNESVACAYFVLSENE